MDYSTWRISTREGQDDGKTEDLAIVQMDALIEEYGTGLRSLIRTASAKRQLGSGADDNLLQDEVVADWYAKLGMIAEKLEDLMTEEFGLYVPMETLLTPADSADVSDNQAGDDLVVRVDFALAQVKTSSFNDITRIVHEGGARVFEELTSSGFLVTEWGVGDVFTE